MKKMMFCLLFSAYCLATPKGYEPLKKSLSHTVLKKVQAAEKDLLSSHSDCALLGELYHPTDDTINPEGFCMYSHKIEQGIYEEHSCVGVFEFPGVNLRTPYFRKDGHWGIPGKCEKREMEKRLIMPNTDKTNNPITFMRLKREQGMNLRILIDEFDMGALLIERTDPKLLPKLEPKIQSTQNKKTTTP